MFFLLGAAATQDFERGEGGQELQKIGEVIRPISDSSSKFGPIFCPKLDEEQKKDLHSNLVRFVCQDQKKKVFTQVWSVGPIFCPKLAEDRKKKTIKKIKKYFTQIWSDFLPKLGCRPKTNLQNIPSA